MLIDRFRLFHTPGEVNPLGIERICPASFQLLHLEIMLFDMFAKDINRIHRHRAIDVDG